MKNNICVLGAFGFIYPHYDGQTIKSRNLLTLLQKKIDDVDYYESQRYKQNKLSVFCLFWKVIVSKTIYYLPARNNLTYMFPFIYLLSKMFNTKVHYIVVGGWLVELLKNKSWHRSALSKIAGIHCETLLMKKALENEYGFRNVDIFPNFRINSFIPTNHHEDGKLKLVFMARINKKKGLDLIFELGRRIVEKNLDKYISIDFYGPLQNENEDKDYFITQIKKYAFMSYYGPLEPNDIYVKLEKYDVMLLPTHYYTEGLPGSILDAYIAGIPVIVTKWKHATEFVDDGKTGIIIPFEDDGTVFFKAVKKLYENNTLLDEMKIQSNKKWKDFSSEKAWELIQGYEKDIKK